MTLIYPMFAMVILTLVTMLVMLNTRMRAVKAGKIKFSYFKTYNTEAPDEILKTQRHYTNLFELPVLFYVACLVAMTRNLEGGILAHHPPAVLRLPT
ncbi:MAG: MAPEG family protein, partial [Bdellovibrionota bacterium]